ncbi:MAG: 50S ribosomal protein L2 [Candidatus Hodgkinia cicadicola]
MVAIIKPTSPGIRALVRNKISNIHNGKPMKLLVRSLCEIAGRNNTGKITVRHRGGRCKRAFRIIDYKRSSFNPSRIVRIEYDPNRTANIALTKSLNGNFRYIIAVEGLKVGDWVNDCYDSNNDLKLGSSTKLGSLSVGTKICNVELYAGAGGVIARSAGCWCQIQAKLNRNVVLKLSSGKKKLFSSECIATIGMVSNRSHLSNALGKAGRSRWLGHRPSVRGVAMNPIDHPLGGGEGKTSGGRHPVSPWGKLTKGKKTVRKRISNRSLLI